MIFRHERDGVLWIDLESPTTEEVREVAAAVDLDPRLAEELTSPSPLPLVLTERDAILLTTHFPTREEGGEVRNQEIDIVVGKNFLITASYEVLTAVHALRKILETEATLGKEKLSIAGLLEVIFTHLYASGRDYTNHVASRFNSIEKEMFNGHERVTVRPISEMSRIFLHIESTIVNQEESLGLFLAELARRDLLGKETEVRIARIEEARAHLARLVATHRALAAELRETNAALLSSSQNEVMKTLTVINFMILPIALVAGIFTMDLPGRALENNPNGFWIVVGLMIAIEGILLVIFTKKRWL